MSENLIQKVIKLANRAKKELTSDWKRLLWWFMGGILVGSFFQSDTFKTILESLF